MNMKFIAGISLMSIAAASFWACGEGEIYESNDEDYMFGLREPDEWVSLKDQALESCAKDETCSAMYADYLANPNADPVEETPASSANQGGQTGTQTSSSSIGGGSDIVISDYSSSSSITFADPDPVTPSSSSVEIVTGLGSCKPMVDPNPINKGETVQWQFEPNPDMYKPGAKYTQMDFITKASYEWSFSGEGVNPTTGTGAKSAAITYSNSGKFSASVVVTMPGAAPETIACSKQLQVNGAAITGCKCTTTATGAVNFLETPSVSWSVSGCTSMGATVNSYTWDGGAASAEPSFAKEFSAATASYAPTLKVGNDDNTEIVVECPAVKVTEGPEYTLKDNKTTIFPITVGSYLMIYGCETSQYHQTPVLVRAPSEAVQVKVNGTLHSISQYGQEAVFSSQTANESITVEVVSGSGEILCQ
jgi:hypothetical protein